MAVAGDQDIDQALVLNGDLILHTRRRYTGAGAGTRRSPGRGNPETCRYWRRPKRRRFLDHAVGEPVTYVQALRC